MMKVKNQYLLFCDYGEYDDARSVPIFVISDVALALSISREITGNPDSPYHKFALDVLGEKDLPPNADISVREIPSIEPENNLQQKLLTKEELVQKLQDGASMEDLFEFRSGQECEIFKAKEFFAGPQILYIPDTALNDIPVNEPVSDSSQQIEYILSECFTGDDFIKECSGDAELAERLFNYCDWQHPSSALPELEGTD